MTKKVFCDVCHVEMTGPSSWVSVFIAVNGSARQFIARGHESRGELDDVCEQCVCIAFAKKLPYDVLRMLAFVSVPHPEEPKYGESPAETLLKDVRGSVLTGRKGPPPEALVEEAGYDGTKNFVGQKTVRRDVTFHMIRAAEKAVQIDRRGDGGAISDRYWRTIWQAMYDAA